MGIVGGRGPSAADFCSVPGFGGAADEPRWSASRLAWHALFYGILAAITVSSVTRGVGAAAPVLVLALALALGGWYLWWMVLRPDLVAGSVLFRVTYFAAAALLWSGLLAVDRTYGVLSIPAVVCLFGYLRWRAALATTVLVFLALLVGQGVHGSLATALQWRGVGWDAVAGGALNVALALVCVYSFRRLAVTRAVLAVAERRAGALEERQRIAGDVHDTLTQGLVSVVMQLEAAQAFHLAGSEESERHVEVAARTARESLQEIRRLVWDLRPEALEQRTLGEALAKLTRELSEQPPIGARTVVAGDEQELPSQVEVTALRVAQEALANVRRHAHAREVTVTLSYVGDLVVVDVQDDGVGFDVPRSEASPQSEGGLGLIAMRERVEALGGTVAVESAPGRGTTVAAQLTQSQARPSTTAAGNRP